MRTEFTIKDGNDNNDDDDDDIMVVVMVLNIKSICLKRTIYNVGNRLVSVAKPSFYELVIVDTTAAPLCILSVK